MIWTLENKKGFIDEKKRKTWQAEQVQCYRTEVDTPCHLATQYMVQALRIIFTLLNDWKKSKEEVYFMT